jgi:hypothetical protein
VIKFVASGHPKAYIGHPKANTGHPKADCSHPKGIIDCPKRIIDCPKDIIRSSKTNVDYTKRITLNPNEKSGSFTEFISISFLYV